MGAPVVYALLALVGGAWAQSSGNSFITQRAANRQKYETELKVSCDTGDDTSCVELFFSLNRMYLAVAAGVVVLIILISLCVWCCFCCKAKHRRLATSSHA